MEGVAKGAGMARKGAGMARKRDIGGRAGGGHGKVRESRSIEAEVEGKGIS